MSVCGDPPARCSSEPDGREAAALGRDLVPDCGHLGLETLGGLKLPQLVFWEGVVVVVVVVCVCVCVCVCRGGCCVCVGVCGCVRARAGVL